MNLKTSLLNHQGISGRYFFPQYRVVDDPLFVDVDGACLSCYQQINHPDGLTLVHFHGNGEAVADYVPRMAELYSRLGTNLLFIEYRAYGKSTGKAELATMLSDGEAVLRQLGISPEKVIVFGRSIGSLYAIELAFRLPDVAGLVIESGIADPYERFMVYADFGSLGCTPDEVKAETLLWFDHKKKLGAYRNPVLILHTEFDQIINITHAERNFSWSASSEKELVRFDEGDHNSIFPMNQAHYMESLKRFCQGVARRL